MKLECKVYPSKGKPITLMNNHRFNENYDLENPTIEKRELRFFINQFVHSYIFSPIISVVDKDIETKIDDGSLMEDEIIEIYDNADKELSGVFFNSDNNKYDSLPGEMSSRCDCIFWAGGPSLQYRSSHLGRKSRKINSIISLNARYSHN